MNHPPAGASAWPFQPRLGVFGALGLRACRDGEEAAAYNPKKPGWPKALGNQPPWLLKLQQHRHYPSNLLVTNASVLAAEEAGQTYRARANQQNCIKELKESYGWDELDAPRFLRPRRWRWA